MHQVNEKVIKTNLCIGDSELNTPVRPAEKVNFITRPVIFIFLMASLLTQLGYAATLQELWKVHHLPTEEQIQDWNQSETVRSYDVFLDEGTPENLKLFSELKNFRENNFTVKRYPARGFLSSWQKVASFKKTLTIQSKYLPTPNEIETMNQLQFKKIIFILTELPELMSIKNTQKLKIPFEVHFQTERYPVYMEKEFLKFFPIETPLSFIQDYWPWYSHMDLFNLIPQKINLHVKETFPGSVNFEYLHNIKRLNHVTVEIDYAQSGMAWAGFKNIPVHWISMGWVPTMDQLNAFYRSVPDFIEGHSLRRFSFVEGRESLNDFQKKNLIQSSLKEIVLIQNAPESKE